MYVKFAATTNDPGPQASRMQALIELSSCKASTKTNEALPLPLMPGMTPNRCRKRSCSTGKAGYFSNTTPSMLLPTMSVGGAAVSCSQRAKRASTASAAT